MEALVHVQVEVDAAIGTWLDTFAKSPVYVLLAFFVALPLGLMICIDVQLFIANYQSLDGQNAPQANAVANSVPHTTNTSFPFFTAFSASFCGVIWLGPGLELFFDVLGMIGAIRHSANLASGNIYATGTFFRMMGTLGSLFLNAEGRSHEAARWAMSTKREDWEHCVEFFEYFRRDYFALEVIFSITSYFGLFGELPEASAIMRLLSRDAKVVSSIMVTVAGVVLLILAFKKPGMALTIYESLVNLVVPACGGLRGPPFPPSVDS